MLLTFISSNDLSFFLDPEIKQFLDNLRLRAATTNPSTLHRRLRPKDFPPELERLSDDLYEVIPTSCCVGQYRPCGAGLLAERPLPVQAKYIVIPLTPQAGFKVIADKSTPAAVLRPMDQLPIVVR